MVAWDSVAVLANGKSLAANEPETAAVSKFRAPVVCVQLEDLEGGTDDTVTVEFDGDAGTYEADSRTLSNPGSYTVEVPQCDRVHLTSTNGVTYSAEVRANPE